MFAARSRVLPFGGVRLEVPPLWVLIGLPLCYFIAGSSSIYAFGINTPIWVSNGLTVATLLRQKQSCWPLLLILTAIADVLANFVNGSGLGVALLICPCDAAENLIIVLVLSRVDQTDLPFGTVPQMIRFTLICLLAPAVSSAAGSGLLTATYGDPFLSGWRTWYLSTTFGHLIVTPLLLSWTDPKLRSAGSGVTALRAVAPSVLVAGVGYIDFHDDLPGLFLAFPFLLFATFNGRLLGATTASAALTIVAIWSTVKGLGPMGQTFRADPVVQTEVLQLYLIAVLITSLPVAVILEQRDRLTARLRETTMQAQAAASAKSEFLAVMSHEIRTPMTGVLGMAELLMQSRLPDKESRYVAGIRTSGRYLLSLVNDILDFSRIEAGKLDLERIDFAISDIFEQVRSLLAPQASEKGLNLSFVSYFQSPSLAKGDPTRLKQVLINLVANGIKFTDRGSVLVAARHTVRQGRHLFQFEVQDTGIGISPERRATLFDAFQQGDSSTTREYGGSGLGLAISKRLVEAMGGVLTVDSIPGMGSRFWFELELELGDAGESETASAGTQTDVPPRHVLLVEDVELNRMLVADMLRSHGHLVELATNGNEAVRLTAMDQFDVILMDVQMPVMDGVEATRRIRALPMPAGGVPVVALSANVMAQERDRYLAAGMNDVLGKPIEWPRLFETLAKYGPKEARPGLESAAGLEPARDHQDETAQGVSAAPPREEENPLDLSVLQKLRMVKGGSSELIIALCDLFIRDTTARLEGLRNALSRADRMAVAGLAHAIRGSAANLGATVMVRLCATIEADADTADSSAISSGIDSLEQEFRRVKIALVAQQPVT